MLYAQEAPLVKKTVITLGEDSPKTVREQAEVILNGHNAGVRLWAPFVYDVTPYIKEGENSLRVFVSNSLANKYSKERCPSGLITSVKLKTGYNGNFQ